MRLHLVKWRPVLLIVYWNVMYLVVFRFSLFEQSRWFYCGWWWCEQQWQWCRLLHNNKLRVHYTSQVDTVKDRHSDHISQPLHCNKTILFSFYPQKPVGDHIQLCDLWIVSVTGHLLYNISALCVDMLAPMEVNCNIGNKSFVFPFHFCCITEVIFYFMR